MSLTPADFFVSKMAAVNTWMPAVTGRRKSRRFCSVDVSAIQRHIDNARRPRQRKAAAHAEVILTVERKIVLDAHTAARAQRHSLQVLVLRQLVGRLQHHRGLAGRHVAHGCAAHLDRGVGISLYQRRRQAQGPRPHCRSPRWSRPAAAGPRTSSGMPNRSRMALAYSVRFNRCSAGAVAAGRDCASRRTSSVEATVVASARDGRVLPGGGIMPARSLRTTFSHEAASCLRALDRDW